MESFPHHYTARARCELAGTVEVTAENAPPIQTGAPPQFGGTDGHWSPETLLIAAVADCYVLTFTAMARASKVAWNSLTCDVDGTLDKLQDTAEFISFELHVALDISNPADENKATRLLHKAESGCLITRSLKAATELHLDVRCTGTSSVDSV